MMKNYVRFFAVVLSAAVMFTAVSVYAENAKPADAGKAVGGDRVAVLDIQKIMTQSEAAKKIRSQLVAKRDAYNKEFSKREKEMKTRYEGLVKDKKTLSETEFDKKRVAFEKDFAAAQSEDREYAGKLEKSFEESLEKLQKEVFKVVEAYAEEQKIGMIFARSQMVIVDSDLDITKIVMDKVNAKVKSVPLNLPK